MLDSRPGQINSNIRPKTSTLVERIVQVKATVDDRQLAQLE
jgi:hypothetical protein